MSNFRRRLMMSLNKIGNDKYVQDGLVVHYDGICNTRSGHNGKSTVWEDLSGNNIDATLSNFNYNNESGWGENYLHLDGLNDYAKIGELNYPNVTIEVVGEFDSNSLDSSLGHDLISNFEGGGYAITTYAANASNKNKNSFTVNVNGQYCCAKSDTNIIIGKRYSLSGSYDGSYIKFWENGIKYETEKKGNIRYPRGNTNLVIGANPYKNKRHSGIF